MIALNKLPDFYPLSMPKRCDVRGQPSSAPDTLRRVLSMKITRVPKLPHDLVAETLRDLGVDVLILRPTTKGKYRCSECKKLGHTKKICPDLHPEDI